MLEAQKEQHERGEAGGVIGFDEAAESALVAVDAGGHGAEVEFDEGIGGVGEEGGDRVGAVPLGDELPGCAGGCEQRLRVLADQELEDFEVVVHDSSVMKGRPFIAGEREQTPLPLVDLGLNHHSLNKVQWRTVATGDHEDQSIAVFLIEQLVNHGGVLQAIDMVAGLTHSSLSTNMSKARSLAALCSSFSSVLSLAISARRLSSRLAS